MIIISIVTARNKLCIKLIQRFCPFLQRDNAVPDNVTMSCGKCNRNFNHLLATASENFRNKNSLFRKMAETVKKVKRNEKRVAEMSTLIHRIKFC